MSVSNADESPLRTWANARSADRSIAWWRKSSTRNLSQGRANVRGLTGRSQPRAIDEVGGEAEDRVHLPIGEFARVLGGGIVLGSIVLVGGDPGIGKSTLMLQMAMEMANSQRVLYVSGEESERQIKMRAMRLLSDKKELPKNLLLVTETNLEVILNHVRRDQTRPADR